MIKIYPDLYPFLNMNQEKHQVFIQYLVLFIVHDCFVLFISKIFFETFNNLIRRICFV